MQSTELLSIREAVTSQSRSTTANETPEESWGREFATLYVAAYIQHHSMGGNDSDNSLASRSVAALYSLLMESGARISAPCSISIAKKLASLILDSNPQMRSELLTLLDSGKSQRASICAGRQSY